MKSARPILATVAHAEVAALGREMASAERRELRAPSVYIERALAAAAAAHGRSVEKVRVAAREAVLRDLFDPLDPTGVGLIRAHATAIAARELKRLEHLFERYGDAIVDVAGAPRLADYALVETGRRFAGCEDELDNLWAYLTAIIHNQAVAAADAALKAHAPGARAHWACTRRVLKRLRDACPDLSEEARIQMAAAEADEYVARNGLTEPERDPQAYERVGERDHGYNRVEFAHVIDMIDRVVADFTRAEQETWAAYKGAGFDSGQVAPTLGISATAASSRLHGLIKKLRGLVEDWRD